MFKRSHLFVDYFLFVYCHQETLPGRFHFIPKETKLPLLIKLEIKLIVENVPT